MKYRLILLLFISLILSGCSIKDDNRGIVTRRISNEKYSAHIVCDYTKNSGDRDYDYCVIEPIIDNVSFVFGGGYFDPNTPDEIYFQFLEMTDNNWNKVESTYNLCKYLNNKVIK